MFRCLRIISLLLLLIILPSINVLAQDPTPEATAIDASTLPDLNGREITIAVENAYPPYNSLDADNTGVGWDYDTFRDICKAINCKPVFQQMAWDGMLLGVSQGSVDVAADGITYTEERAQTVDFGNLYQSYDETLLVRADETRFSTADELKLIPDYIVGTQIGTTNEITSHKIFGEANVKSYDQFPVAVQALLNKDVDAVEVDRPAAEGFILAQGGMKTLEESLSGVEGLSFAYPKGSDLVAPINAAMAYLQSTGRWEQIYTRWFNEPELPDLAGREVTIAVENAYPPYNSLDADNKGVGWDYDTFNALCQRLNCKPVFQQMAWDGMLLGVSQGSVDVAADGITYTEERAQTVDFGSLYQSYDETLLVRADETRFSTADELKLIPDYIVGTQIGTTNEITSHKIFGEANVKSYDQFPVAVQALLNKDVDAVEVDRPAAEGFILAQGGMKTLEESLSGVEGLAFAYPKGSDLVAPINAAMAAMEADGTWDDIYHMWFDSAN